MAIDLQEFVAEELWLLIGIVTFALISLVGILGLEAVAGILAIVGWFFLAPIFLFWGEEIADWWFEAEPTTTATTDRSSEDDAIDELKRQYAEGRIDDEEFEHRLERLVGVEEALEDVFSGGRTSESMNEELERERER
ncbi:SHOCT domain-containing protein [Natronobacterium texcoconense]|uniref:Uncharacterized membrane protein n=1 Tax=Natronobacterium texcoconense TaxID=1095778 RepID=A0A1H1FMM4_NATTX|nr:hypothetical protein [Natronobacterium texcoconense]SDR02303.1 Uncharacterized membrane protein [Natronobacterium texcoconense]